MSNAIKTYKEIISDFSKAENYDCSHLNRSILLTNKIRILYVVMACHHQRIIAVMLPNEFDQAAVERFPKWHGIETKIGNITAYANDNDESSYVIISQSQNYDSSIFEIIANDISAELEKIADSSQVVRCLSVTLHKWKKFFEINREIIMSEQAQQGLYGELLFLKRILPVFGNDSVKFWCGADKETHDFYINGHAVEVKTTSSKTNEKIKISSEQQMDNADVSGKLFLYVNMIRRSGSDGETLPEIIKDILRDLDDNAREIFEEKLFNYGYIISCPEKYKSGYFLRAKKCYNVIDNFPCITRSKVMLGLSEISYSIDLNVCNEFQTEWNDMINVIKEA